jgi:p-aminobenzoyl-glutamate transporter AbgT
MIPARFAQIAFGFFLSMIMSAIISGVSTLSAVGAAAMLSGIWVEAWLSSWLIAFPSVLVVAPIARRIVGRLVKPPS